MTPKQRWDRVGVWVRDRVRVWVGVWVGVRDRVWVGVRVWVWVRVWGSLQDAVNGGVE